MISLAISTPAKPWLIICTINGKNPIEALTLAVSINCRKRPKQTSYGNTGR